MLKGVLIFLSVAAGTAIGYRSGLYSIGSLMVCMAVGLRFFIALRLGKDFNDYKRLTRLHSVWPCLLLCGAGALSGAWHSPSPSELPLRQEVGIIAEVTDRFTTTLGERYDIVFEDVAMSGGESVECRNVRGVLWTSAGIVLEPGDVVSYRSVINRPDNIGQFSDIYYTYDKVRVYENRLNSRGNEVYHYRDGGLRIIDHRDGLLVKAWKWREDITVMLENSPLSDESAQLMRALLTGKRSGVKEERLDGFRDAGVAHTLAVSGMHVGILAGLLLWITLPLNLVGGRKWRFLLTLVVVWVFALLTGLQVSILRSTLMLTLVVIALLTDRRRNAFYGLCMAGAMILLVWPESLWDVAFQLSFICVAALCLLGEQLNPMDRRAHPGLHDLVGMLMATLVATGATWVISAYWFGSMPLHFVTANIMLLPVLPVLMGVGLIYLFILAIGIEGEWLAHGIDMAVDCLYRFIDLFKGTSVTVTPSVWTVIVWTSGVVALVVGVHRYRPQSRMRTGALPLLDPVTPEGRTRICWPGVWTAIGLWAMAIGIEIVRILES